MLKTESLQYKASKTSDKERIRWDLPDNYKLLRTYIDNATDENDVQLEIIKDKKTIFWPKPFVWEYIRTDDNLEIEINKFYQDFLDNQ